MKRRIALLALPAAALLLTSCVVEKDVTFSVYSAYWSDVADEDADGYASSAYLNFDVDADDGNSHTVYVVVSAGPSSSSTYSTYHTTEYYTITGSATSDAYSIAVGLPHSELSNNTYDFLIEVYDENNQLVASYSDGDDVDLNDEAFETSTQDPIPPYSVYDAWWYDTVDVGGDGYWSSGKLSFDIDVGDGLTHSVYARVSYKLSTSSLYTDYATSNYFDITGNNLGDSYYLTVGDPNDELPYGVYDFKIDVYTASGILVATYSALSDVDLNDEWFETWAQDNL